jgi:transketolase
MRKAFIKTVEDVFEVDDKTILILGDIGVFGFKPLKEKYPDRVINIGICEQSSISIIAGLSKEGFHPIFYTIAPFAVERCLEQIKIDLAYQGLNATIVSVGGSYDYPGLGCTHHCPGDVELLQTIPNMRIFFPSNEYDMSTFMKDGHGISLMYLRLSERKCKHDIEGNGLNNMVIACGDTIDRVYEACKDMSVNIYQCFVAGEYHLLSIDNDEIKKVAVVEPFYEGTMLNFMTKVFPDAQIRCIGIPRKFLTNYGTIEEHDKACGLDSESIRLKLKEFFNE